MDPQNTETVEAAEIVTETPEVVETPEVSDEDAMGDIYDKLTADEVTTPDRDASGKFVAKDAGDVVADAVDAVELEEAVNEDTDEPETVEAVDTQPPSFLPHDVREAWKDIPEAARAAVVKSQQEMGAKLAEMGRRAQGFEPVAQEIQRAAQQFPELMNQTPQEIAKDVFELAHTRANLRRDPIGTMMQVAQEMGVLDQLAAKFGGQGGAQNPQLDSIRTQQEIAQLKQQLQSVNNPANIQGIVSQEIAARDANNEVMAFASGKEHWTTVENDLPRYIQAAQLTSSEGASNTDILNAAYDMAINAYGLKATTATPAKAVAKPDPKRTEAVIKAKSANVTSRGSKAAPLTEMDALGSAYDRMMSS